MKFIDMEMYNNYQTFIYLFFGTVVYSKLNSHATLAGTKKNQKPHYKSY